MPIEKEHLRELKDITEENRAGQRSDTLAWFWRMGTDGGGPEWSVESEFISYLLIQLLTSSVMRVNWLRAKARRDRWDEELQLVLKEMEWTVRGFESKGAEWTKLKKSHENERGLRQYAAKQEGMWLEMAQKAAETFLKEAGVEC